MQGSEKFTFRYLLRLGKYYFSVHAQLSRAWSTFQSMVNFSVHDTKSYPNITLNRHKNEIRTRYCDRKIEYV